MPVNKGTNKHERPCQGAVTATREYAGCDREIELCTVSWELVPALPEVVIFDEKPN